MVRFLLIPLVILLAGWIGHVEYVGERGIIVRNGEALVQLESVVTQLKQSCTELSQENISDFFGTHEIHVVEKGESLTGQLLVEVTINNLVLSDIVMIHLVQPSSPRLTALKSKAAAPKDLVDMGQFVRRSNSSFF